MTHTFTLHCKRIRSGSLEHGDLPAGRVRLVGEPRIGERLVIVGDDAGAVVQTSTVRGVVTSARGIVVQTANSLYTLTCIAMEPAAANAA